MKTILALILAFMPLLTVTAGTRQQEAAKQLTIRERAEAQRILATFASRLEETLDVAEAINNLCAENWLIERLKSEDSPGILLLSGSRELALSNPVEYERYYLMIMRLAFVAGLYKTTLPEDDDCAICLPPAALRITREDQRLSALLGDGEDEPQIEDVAQLRALTDSLEKVFIATRDDLLRLKTEREDEFTKALSKIRRLSADAKLSAENCDDQCLGFPQGTRMLHADPLPFCITMANVEGRMKIVMFLIYSD
ncbi:MAG: hypothetical protein U0Z53_19400 [Blastocatellia bacterium]